MPNLANELGMKLCASWGIKPSECKRIEIVFDAEDRRPYAYITMLLNEEVMKVVLQLESRTGE